MCLIKKYWIPLFSFKNKKAYKLVFKNLENNTYSTLVVKYPIKLGELYKGEWGTSNPLLVSLRMSITSSYIHCFKELTTALWCYANVAYNTPMCIIEVLIPKYTLYWVGKHGDIAVRKAKYVKELNMY